MTAGVAKLIEPSSFLSSHLDLVARNFAENGAKNGDADSSVCSFALNDFQCCQLKGKFVH